MEEKPAPVQEETEEQATEKPAPVQQPTEINIPISDLEITPKQAADMLSNRNYIDYSELTPQEALRAMKENSLYILSNRDEIKKLSQILDMNNEEFNEYLDNIDGKAEAELAKLVEVAAAIESASFETLTIHAASLPRVTTAPLEKLKYPIDKVNSQIWNLLEEADPNGQMAMEIDASRKNSEQNAIILYDIIFEEIDPKLARRLTPFDKRVYIAVTGLYNAGYEYFTASQIYFEMGNTTRPNKDDIRKINESLTKMGKAVIHIDNIKESQIQKKRKHFVYDSSLLPFERASAYINNQLVESAIHPFREPPVATFARERKQITTISPQLLKSPINKTDANLRIDDYLIEQISFMKRNRRDKIIKYETLYENCLITTAKQQQRAPKKIKTYLEHYKKTGWIKDFDMDTRKDGIIIMLPSKRK